jgi:phosphoribosylformylglycinamidine (FGAM) synthase-like enzyme
MKKWQNETTANGERRTERYIAVFAEMMFSRLSSVRHQGKARRIKAACADFCQKFNKPAVGGNWQLFLEDAVTDRLPNMTGKEQNSLAIETHI